MLATKSLHLVFEPKEAADLRRALAHFTERLAPVVLNQRAPEGATLTYDQEVLSQIVEFQNALGTL